MDLADVQREVRDLYLARDKARGLHATFLWLVEEVGELAEAVRKHDEDNVRAELADVVAWTASVANLLDVDLAAAYRAKYPEGRCGACGGRPCACPTA